MTVIEIHKTDETESKYDWKSAGQPVSYGNRTGAKKLLPPQHK